VSRPVLAFVVNSLDPGGAERMALEMAIALRVDHDVRVWCLDGPGAWAGRLREAGIPVRALWRQPGIDLGLAVRLAAELRAAGAGIVHAHQCSAWFYAALARALHGGPRLLLEEHGRFWPEADRPVRRWVNRLAIVPLTHRFVAVSTDVAGRLARFEGIPADRIAVIPNGIAAAEPCDPVRREALRASLGFGPRDVVVGTVGRLDPVKNLPMLVAALERAGWAHSRVRGLIVGDGPQRAEVERLLRDAGLNERVVLAGHREDARELVACLDLFVLASFSEGISVALLESMSAGIPAAVTAVGGNVDLVEPGEGGWLVASDDFEALASAISEAAGCADRRAARGAAARRRFEAHFTQAVMLDAYRALYAGMLEGDHAPRRLAGSDGAAGSGDARATHGGTTGQAAGTRSVRWLKRIAFGVAAVLVAPLAAAAWLERRAGAGEQVFAFGGQLLALAPGLPGAYLRAAYYRATLERCHWEVHVGFGSVLLKRGASLGAYASMGCWCVIGHASIGSGAMIGSRVSVPSGRRQHLDEQGRLTPDAGRFEPVAIGAGSWIGEGAIVMADVGEAAIVAAGAVVSVPVPRGSTASGNPARVVRAAVPAGV